MRLDITNIDRKMLLKGLLAYASPVGLGIADYNYRKSIRDNVDGLTDDECEELLYEFETKDEGYTRVVDYYKGQPIKLDLLKKKSGQIIVDTTGYDTRNGKYKFFEVMLDFFLEDEIIVLTKGYPQHLSFQDDDRNIKPFKSIIKNLISKQGNYGKYWIIDTNHESYINPIRNILDIK